MQRLNQTSALSSPLTQQLMPRGEQHQVVWSWNDTATRYPQGEACLHELVEAQVARTPEAIAVSVEGEQLSYRQLEQRAERLAARLRTLGVAPDVVVGICAERSVELVVGLLAILKAGGAYLPLDPSYPRQRLSFMLSDARAPVLLIQQRLRPLLPAFSGSVLAIEEASQRTDARSAPRRRVRPANLAYVIYTSGSTGRPKGVLCHHRGIVNRLLWMEEACQLTPADRVLQKTPASFDVSIWELFAPLVFGARLVLARPGGHRDPDYLARRIAESRITLTHFVPSMLRIFLEEPSIGERCKSLRRVVSSGEALSAELAERFDARLGATGAILQNLYGPTEAAVEVTSWCCQPGAGEAAVPIGRPIANVRIQLLDQHLRLLPAGVAGELHIGGVGLARGYWGRPGQTAEQFIPSPFATGERLYKSGDLARARPTGAVDFLGRIDQQVKVRGFRIEPGEIEAALSTHPAVRAAAVLATASGSTTGEQRLQACVVLRRGADPAPDDADLRDFLAAKVPPAMIPSAWMRLDRLPLTPSGKLDRTALDRLAAQHLKSVGSDQSAGAARTELEATVLALLQQLLGLEKLGIHQDLFALGAHSLVVAQLLARLRQQLHLEVSPPEVFAARTVAALAERLEAARRTPQAPVMPPLRPTPRDRDLPLSFPQERVWFLNQLVPGMLAYNVQFTIRLHGTLQPQLLERSFSEIVRRHELLRTTFPTRRGKPVQLIHPPYTMRIPRIDLRAMAQGEREGEVRRCIAEAVRHPFDITQLPLVRLYLFTLDDQQNLLLQIEQHFVHDGWSISRILSETQELYTAYAAGRPSPLPELEVQYADFAVWQRRWLRGEVLQRQLRYWTERLAGSPLEIDLPLDRRRGDAFRFRGDAAFVELPAELYTALRAASRRQRMSLFMTALAAFLTLLHRYGGQKDIVLGTTVANRRLQETESLIGMMVNTILLRNDLSGDPRFTQFLTQVLRTTLEAQEYQDLPFDKLVEALQPERHLSRNPLFQVMFSFHDSPVPELDFGGLTGEWQLAHNRSSKMDLNVTVVPRAEQRARRQVETAGDPIRFIWEFNTDVFDRTTILRLSQNYRTLLEALVADPEQRLSELPLLQPAEHHQLFNEWGLGELGHGHAGGLHHLVQRQVQQTPEAIALVTGEDHLSYRQLDAQAGQLARDLRRLGVGPEVVVGVCMERSPELLVALLAILTARGVYLPVDPHYPEARRAFILGDAQARLLLTQKHLAPAFEPILRGTATKLLALEAARPTAIEFGDPGLDAPVEDEQLAYLIYTSGSTGHPKGVGVRHSSAVNFVRSMAHRPGVAAGDTLLAVTTLSFDIAVAELFLPLVVGARIVLAERRTVADADALAVLITASAATVMQATPATWRLLLDAGWQPPPGLRIWCGGEALPRELAEGLMARGHQLWNLYGPTETTVWSAIDRLTPGTEVTIGRPIAATSITLLDAALRPVPTGVAGEATIGGAGVARGYFRRPATSAERFAPDPFSDVPGTRLYRTGDRVLRLADGRLRYAGRMDHQLKIRGFRIEPGEIEVALTHHPAVRQAVVTASTLDRDRRLVAYLVPAQDRAPTDDALRTFLRQRLPDYMLPARFVELDTLPLTPNGKIDRRALPAPTPDRPQLTKAFVPPRSDEERAVAEAWSQALGIDPIGAEDDFFVLGGHSLQVPRILAQLERTFAVQLTLASLFQNPTVAGLSRRIVAARSIARSMAQPIAPASIAPAAEREEFEL